MPVARHFFSNHLRLAITMAVGISAVFMLPPSWAFVTRLLAGWNITAWLYLCLMGWLMMRAGHAQVRKLAEQEDESWVVVLAIMSIASMASLGAIFLQLPAAKDLSAGLRLLSYAFTFATVFGSWCLLGILFTHHYARLFYRAPPDRRPLHFPDDEQNPDYWDFLYFSFTLAVAVQTSDVSVMANASRRVVLIQSLIFFLFNLAIFGLSINIAASLVGT